MGRWKGKYKCMEVVLGAVDTNNSRTMENLSIRPHMAACQINTVPTIIDVLQAQTETL